MGLRALPAAHPNEHSDVKADGLLFPMCRRETKSPDSISDPRCCCVGAAGVRRCFADATNGRTCTHATQYS
jgi:hypothetical protein